MKRLIPALLLLCIAGFCFAQPPQRPLLALNAYTLGGYQAIDSEQAFSLPEGLEFASVSAVAFNSVGHLIVLHRSPEPFIEFDAQGNFIRSFGSEGLFTRSHGLRIDAEDNLWVTDFIGHTVMKLDSDGNILMSLGIRNEAGEWNVDNNTQQFNQPNDIAFDSAGNFYVAQGHGLSAEPRVLKFTSEGEFITQWGRRGTGSSELAVAHSIEIDEQDNIYIADRENQRIQIYDTDGNFINSWGFAAMACSIYLHDDGYMYMTTGFDGELAKLDMEGTVIGSIGSPGAENGQFGEGHALTVDANGNIYVADVVNRRIQKFARY